MLRLTAKRRILLDLVRGAAKTKGFYDILNGKYKGYREPYRKSIEALSIAIENARSTGVNDKYLLAAEDDGYQRGVMEAYSKI